MLLIEEDLEEKKREKREKYKPSLQIDYEGYLSAASPGPNTDVTLSFKKLGTLIHP